VSREPDSYLLFGRAREKDGALGKPFGHVKALFPAATVRYEAGEARPSPWIYLDFSSEAPYILPFWNVEEHIKSEVEADSSMAVLAVPTTHPDSRKAGDAHRYFFARTCATEVSSALGLGRHLGFLRGHVLPLTPKYLYRRLLDAGVGKDLTACYVRV